MAITVYYASTSQLEKLGGFHGWACMNQVLSMSPAIHQRLPLPPSSCYCFETNLNSNAAPAGSPPLVQRRTAHPIKRPLELGSMTEASSIIRLLKNIKSGRETLKSTWNILCQSKMSLCANRFLITMVRCSQRVFLHLCGCWRFLSCRQTIYSKSMIWFYFSQLDGIFPVCSWTFQRLATLCLLFFPSMVEKRSLFKQKPSGGDPGLTKLPVVIQSQIPGMTLFVTTFSIFPSQAVFISLSKS